MKKISVITKNFPRHFEFIASIMDTGLLCGIVMVLDDKNEFVKGNDILNKYYQNSEHKFFGNKYNNISKINTITMKDNDINTDKVISFINNNKTDLTIIFDIDNISTDTLYNIKSDIWRVCFGYVQQYIGYNCNIYAALNKKAQSICTSLVKVDNTLHNGSIIHQTQSNFRPEDTVTDVEFRSLKKMIYDMEKLINLYNNDKIIYYSTNNNAKFIDKNHIDTLNIKDVAESLDLLAKNLIDNENYEFIKQI